MCQNNYGESISSKFNHFRRSWLELSVGVGNLINCSESNGKVFNVAQSNKSDSCQKLGVTATTCLFVSSLATAAITIGVMRLNKYILQILRSGDSKLSLIHTTYDCFFLSSSLFLCSFCNHLFFAFISSCSPIFCPLLLNGTVTNDLYT